MLPASGREVLSPDIEVDWDETPTFFQAASVAHGHLLHFKQRWYADGYSLGDLLYSLPLAPGQKKLISVVDWERREQTQRLETTTARDSLDALVTRDRDLGEVVNGAMTESMRGGSRNTTAGIGAGTAGAGSGSYYGMNFGSLVGVSGGYGESNSGAWQVSGKTIAADSMQTLRDKTLQSASSVRSLRTSVVQTVSQGESTRVTTEVVANHNHCHALTIQYFEVLRHLRVAHELADVRECLFVPLPISPFTAPKTLRWRQSLETYLRRPELAPAFDATRRVETAWSEVDYPVGRYADEQVTEISGEIELTILIPLPPLPPRPLPKPEQTADEVAKTLKQATDPTAGFLGVVTAIATLGASVITNEVVKVTENTTKAAIEGSRALAEEMLAETSPQAQYEKFHREVMPGVAVGFVDQLELYALVRGSEIRIPADFTLVSDYRPAVALLASVRATLPPGISRGQITQIRVKSSNGLPNGCRVIVNSATFRYRTRLFEHALVEDRRANDDIDLPVVSVSFDAMGIPVVNQVAAGQGAALSTPLDAWEQRDPRIEDRRLTATLIEHLNEHLEFYHHALWWTMDPNRRYMLLDGFEAPRAGGRSIASVVENRLIGIIGNSLVLQVANGVQLDPRVQAAPPQPVPNGNGPALSPLLRLYDTEPLPPASIALPTRGVFAEAVMGECNACEQIDESRFWRWEESPIDEPPAIEPASTATRRAEPQDTRPTALPTPIVAIQNAPDIPGPAGVAAALDALGKQVFADITGLAGTQANAAAAYSKALDTALAFGKEASALTQQAAALGSRDRTLAAIDKAEQERKITPEEAKRLRTTAIEKSLGMDGQVNTADAAERLGLIKSAAQDGSISTPAAARLSESLLRSYATAGDSVTDERAAAAKLIDQLPSDSVTSIETGEPPTTVTASGRGSAPAQPTQDQLETQFARSFPGLISPIPGFVDTRPDYTLWNFDVGSADLKKFETALEGPEGTFLAQWRDRGFRVDIVGVASTSGPSSLNDSLSYARALAVANMYERELDMPSERMTVRWQGASDSLPPPNIFETLSDIFIADEMVWRAWNRRVELHVIREEWTDDVWDRIINFLGTGAAPVANDVERQRAIALATRLKNPASHDLYFFSMQALVNSVALWWNVEIRGTGGATYSTFLKDPSRWERMTPRFVAHMREQLASEALPSASDLELSRRLVFMLRQMQRAAGELDAYLQVQSQGVDAIQIVYKKMDEWIRDQLQTEDSVYWIL
jgi:outer membrane protein OmpA-like peptidoglycan-associated protein